ncbi:hypothetical protein ACNKHK_18570 [Shigella flexneri]
MLAAAVNAARVRATLGEISNALETAFDRYLVPSQCVTGVIRTAITSPTIRR